MSDSRKSLIIAEKPSVAQDIAKALGGFKKTGDILENDQFVIAAAAGHLVELFMPEDIDKKTYGFWRLGTLPIIPESFSLKVIDDARTRDRFQLVKKKMQRKDVITVLKSCDAGRGIDFYLHL